MKQISLRLYVLPVLAMVAVVAASNVLVQFPVELRLGPVNFADFLTWGAFTYPFAFLVNDLTNRRLGAYVAHFNAHDFDAIRAMIADDVRLELVNKTRLSGKTEVSRYFGNYSNVTDWHLVPGLVEGRPAILVFDPEQPGAAPRYFVLLRRSGGKVADIRDFRHAPYVIDGAEYRI